jgi:hypothetical protein
VFEGICRGDGAWLEIAALLRPAADAGAAEDLDQAMAEAIIHAPQAALTLVGNSGGPAQPFEVDFVCGNYEVLHRRAKDSGLAARARWLGKQESAVRRVGDPALQGVRARCLARIRAARASLND